MGPPFSGFVLLFPSSRPLPYAATNTMLKKRNVQEFGRKVKLALTTREGFRSAVEVETSDFAPSSHGFIWSNAHMDPSPPSERTWTWYHYFAVWYAYNFTSGAWSAASSLLSLNVNWWQAVLACLVGSLISGVAIVLNSRQSSVYHIGFPTLQRVSFGRSSQASVCSPGEVSRLTHLSQACTAPCFRFSPELSCRSCGSV